MAPHKKKKRVRFVKNLARCRPSHPARKGVPFSYMVSYCRLCGLRGLLTLWHRHINDPRLGDADLPALFLLCRDMACEFMCPTSEYRFKFWNARHDEQVHSQDYLQVAAKLDFSLYKLGPNG